MERKYNLYPINKKDLVATASQKRRSETLLSQPERSYSGLKKRKYPATHSINLLNSTTTTQSSIKSSIFQIQDFIREQNSALLLMKAPLTSAEKMIRSPKNMRSGSHKSIGSIHDYISQISHKSEERSESDQQLFEKLKVKAWSSSIDSILEGLQVKSVDEALRSVLHMLGLFEILWNKMLEVELLMLYKSEFTLDEGGSSIFSKIYPQCFQNRGLSYVNIIQKFNEMLTHLSSKEKLQLSRVVSSEKKMLGAIERVQDENKMTESLLNKGFRTLKDFFRGEEQALKSVLNLEHNTHLYMKSQIQAESVKNASLFSTEVNFKDEEALKLNTELKGVYEENQELEKRLDLEREKYTKEKEGLLKQIQSLEKELLEFKEASQNELEDRDRGYQVLLEELKEKLREKEAQVASKEVLCKNYHERLNMSQRLSANSKILEESYGRMLEKLTKMTNEKETLEEDAKLWKKRTFELQEKIEKGRKQVQAGKELYEEFQNVGQLRDEIIILKVEKETERKAFISETEELLKEVVKLRDILSANKDHITRFEELLRIKDKEINMLRETLRTFTTWAVVRISKNMDFDQTFEAVLKAEFEMMKSSFTKQVDKLNSKLENQGRDMGEQLRMTQRENKDLKLRMEMLTQRVAYFKAKTQ